MFRPLCPLDLDKTVRSIRSMQSRLVRSFLIGTYRNPSLVLIRTFRLWFGISVDEYTFILDALEAWTFDTGAGTGTRLHFDR
jgi:hypothetical protein